MDKKSIKIPYSFFFKEVEFISLKEVISLTCLKPELNL